MAQLFTPPYQQTLDANANAISGARLFFYVSGTTTPAPVYADADLSVPLAAPVVADAAGRFVPIYLDVATSYRVVVADAAGATIRDVDPYGDSGLVNAINIITQRAPITVQDYGASGGGANDYTAFNDATQAAFDERRSLKIPKGDWRVDQPIVLRIDDYLSYVSGYPFGTAPKITGEGFGRTAIDFRGTGFLFDVDSNAAHTNVSQGFFYGLEIGGMTIRSTVGTGTRGAIKLRSAYQPWLHDLHVMGMSGDGIALICSTGDYDACNMPAIERVRVENCGGWGVVIGEPGHNETSFTRMVQAFIQSCGTASAASTPPSGGMRWSGQLLVTELCAFTLCQNVPLFIPGQSGLPQSWFTRATTFENNFSRAAPLIRGLSNGGGSFQMYSNDQHVATVGLEIDGATHTVRNLAFDQCLVRATAGNNPFTAFKLTGANAMAETIRVRNTVWDNFDYTGQTRFDGFRFDNVPECCALVLDSATSLVLRPDGTGRGNFTPLRLRGAGSTSGEWVASDVSTVGITNAGLAANTRYYGYLYDNNNVKALELSTTAPVVDAAAGYLVKTGDATRAYKGSVETDAGALFKLTGGGWLDALRVPGSQVGVPGRMWIDAGARLHIKTSPGASDADGLPIPVRASAQADSTATTIADLRTDFNALLAKLRTAGAVAP